ncbi:unnamed protein product, partial [marine sediment metagenome]
ELSPLDDIEEPNVHVRLQKNPPHVCIDDDDKLPAEFIITPPVPDDRPDKAALKKALTAGQKVPGARLDYSFRVVID